MKILYSSFEGTSYQKQNYLLIEEQTNILMQ